MAALLLLAACSGGDPGAAGRQTAPSVAPVVSPSAAALPDDLPVATDGPRPSATDVVVSFAGWDAATATVQIGGYVSPLVESGGTCTVELQQQDDRVVTVSAPAVADATTTVCGGLSVSGGELRPGTWSVVLRYGSATTSGSSEPVTVEVPR